MIRCSEHIRHHKDAKVANRMLQRCPECTTDCKHWRLSSDYSNYFPLLATQYGQGQWRVMHPSMVLTLEPYSLQIISCDKLYFLARHVEIPAARSFPLFRSRLSKAVAVSSTEPVS